MEKQETIFRQKSIERVSSPEQLDAYLKVTSPTVWLSLIGIIIILVGAIIWGTFGELKTYTSVGCKATGGNVSCYIKESEASKIESGMFVEIPDEKIQLEIISIDNKGVTIDNDDYLQHLVQTISGDYVFKMTCFANIDDGYYQGQIVTETISPLEFILN